jgi:coatomer subunit beta
LAIKESDNNVKLIVLDKVNELHEENEGVLEELVMDILRVLSSPDIDVRNKALEIALKMVTSRNVEEVIGLLKKDLIKTVEQDYEKASHFNADLIQNNEYRQLLINAIHTCAIRYSEVAASGIHLLMEFMSEFSNTSAADVISFIKEVVEKFPNLRKEIIAKLLATLSDIKAKKVFRGALWILGEYCTEEKDIKDAVRAIRNSVGELPILDTEQKLLAKQDEEEVNGTEVSVPAPSKHRILADGTYATESALTDSKAAAKLEAVKASSKPPLRSIPHCDIVNISVDLGWRLLSRNDPIVHISQVSDAFL